MGTEWTTTPPTELGWYWAYRSSEGLRGYKLIIEVVRNAWNQNLEVCWTGGAIPLEWFMKDYEFSKWSGPLPNPDLPE